MFVLVVASWFLLRVRLRLTAMSSHVRHVSRDTCLHAVHHVYSLCADYLTFTATKQALKYTLLSASEAQSAGKWQAIVYDWCVVGGRSGVVRAAPPASDKSIVDKEAGETHVEDDDDDDEAMMSVMEELSDDSAQMLNVREGSVGYQQSREAARIINADGVHVLVVLDGWNVKNRNTILMHRPCAVQVGALGHRASMADTAAGVAMLVDAVVGGRVSTPPEYAAHFSEGLVILPLGYMPPCPTRQISRTPPVQFSSLPEMAAHDDPAAQRRAAREQWGGEGKVIMGVFGPIESLSREAFSAWSTALSAADAQIKISLPAMTAQAVPWLQAELASYGSSKGGEGGNSSVGVGAGEMANTVAGWHLDVMGNKALNTSMRLYAADVVLDTWRVSAGPLVAKALAMQRPILTFPQESMASRTGAEHALALRCQGCAIARSSQDAALYAAVLARRAIKTATSASSPTEYQEYGALTPKWSMHFVKGLRLLLQAYMAAEQDSDQEAGRHADWGLRYQVAVAR